MKGISPYLKNLDYSFFVQLFFLCLLIFKFQNCVFLKTESEKQSYMMVIYYRYSVLGFTFRGPLLPYELINKSITCISNAPRRQRFIFQIA